MRSRETGSVSGPSPFNVVCGLPRTGSTLLCNVLNQNPKFWASRTSILGELVALNIHALSNRAEIRGALAKDKEGTQEHLKTWLAGICLSWHGNREAVVFDKDRTWNYNLVALYSIFPDAKPIVIVRDLREIFASIEKQHRNTGFFDDTSGLSKKTLFGRADDYFSPEGPVGAPLKGVKDILDRKFPVCWVKYEDFAQSPKNTMSKIYKHLDLPFYEDHDFEDVQATGEDPDYLFLGKFPHEGTGRITPPKKRWDKFMSEEIGDLISAKFSWFQKRFGYDARPPTRR